MEEYMEVCYKLWDSWEEDAIIADRASGIYADPAKVHEVDHQGEFFKCRGRSFVFRSPQWRPVLWQAGSSDRGRDFAAKHAEAIFAVHPRVERMREYTADLDQRLVTTLRSQAGSVKRIYGLQTAWRRPAAEAQEKWERIKANHPARRRAGVDLRSLRAGLHEAQAGRLRPEHRDPRDPGAFRLGDLLQGRGASDGEGRGALSTPRAWACRLACGTATDIADQMEFYMDEGGADGFMLAATYTPGCFEEFVDYVVPELQRRGRCAPSTAVRHPAREPAGEIEQNAMRFG